MKQAELTPSEKAMIYYRSAENVRRLHYKARMAISEVMHSDTDHAAVSAALRRASEAVELHHQAELMHQHIVFEYGEFTTP